MFVALVGCGHGKLVDIYRELDKQEIKVELLIICGDFQAIRNKYDLSRMACPEKYKKMQDFHLYYSGQAKAPIPTLFIGGNHEAPNYLWELWFGGFAAPSIYYMGTSGVVWFGGLRIAGISGIFKSHDYHKAYSYEDNPPSFEGGPPPRSPYHYRELEVTKLQSVETLVDIMVSHDWPNKIYSFGAISELLKRKPHFQRDIKEGSGLGSPPLMNLLIKMKPRFWFSGHLHVKYSAIYPHQGNLTKEMQVENTCLFKHPIVSSIDETDIHCTRFLALDKCLPRRQYLQIINIEEQVEGRPRQFYYDPEWIEILRNSNEALLKAMPWADKLSLQKVMEEEVKQTEDYAIYETFEKKAPTLDEEESIGDSRILIY